MKKTKSVQSSIDPSSNQYYMEMEKLPPEVALEIFCRLPPESVVRCKLVCKSWLSLLRGGDDRNYFANMHLRRHLEYPITLNFIALYQEEITDEDDYDMDERISSEFYITEYDEEKSSYKMVKTIDFAQIMSFGSMDIRTRLVGSCNGLLCFTNGLLCFTIRYHNGFYTIGHRVWDDRIGICNPLLNEYVILPNSNVLRYHTDDMVIGFGHNPLTDEYKVVSVSYSDSDACYNNIGDVEVYTLGTNMWRSIGTIKYKLHVCSQPVLVNGLLHWLSQDQQLNEITREVVGEHQLIVSFDFEIEEFHVISLPYNYSQVVPREEDVNFSKMIEGGLKELGGCLCLITRDEVKGLMDIWVLKDYMNKESWVKEFSIHLNESYSLCPIKKKKKNGNAGDGDGDGDESDDEILYLWRNSKRLVTYDPKTQYIKDVDQGSDPMYFAIDTMHDPVLHIDSLVSLKALGEYYTIYWK